MALTTDQRWMWIGIGFLAAGAFHLIRYQLEQVRQMNEVKADGPAKQTISRETEDALPVETLAALAKGHNYELRSGAFKIICDRAARSPGFKNLLLNVASKDEETRSQGLTALTFMMDQNLTNAQRFDIFPAHFHYLTFYAIITALCNMTPNTYGIPGLDTVHSPDELLAINMIFKLVHECRTDTLPVALRAGLVTRWLKAYPFAEDKRATQEVFLKLLKLHSDLSPRERGRQDKMDSKLPSLIYILVHNAEARKQMRYVGLLSSSFDEHFVGDDAIMYNGSETAGELPRWAQNRRNSTLDQERARRARREAMVIGDEGQPLGRDNIFGPVEHSQIGTPHDSEEVATADELISMEEALAGEGAMRGL
ncbi:MAG: hypothetical protein M1824_001226 [Vezdaea acicularis]|nr:MAG: hypothetical protein M1824_001226 [Vezdaea acicularis]